MGKLEPIAPILSRALKDLQRSWERQEEEEVERKDQGDNTTANQG